MTNTKGAQLSDIYKWSLLYEGCFVFLLGFLLLLFWFFFFFFFWCFNDLGSQNILDKWTLESSNPMILSNDKETEDQKD